MACPCLRFAVVYPLLSYLLLTAAFSHPKPALLPHVQTRPDQMTGKPGDQEPQPTDSSLSPGGAVLKAMKGGESHSYPLTLKANDFLQAIVEQKGLDVVVRLIGPDGKTVQEVDHPNRMQGSEPLSYIAEQAGTYRLEVAAVAATAPPGKYELKLEALRMATDQDRATIEIEALLGKVGKFRSTGKYDDALPVATQALEKSEKVFGPVHPLVFESLNNLATCYWAKRDYARADPLYQRALAIREKLLGSDHPEFAKSLNNLAMLYQNKGDYAKAEPLLQRVLAIWEKVPGPPRPEVAISLNNLAVFYWRKGDYPKAETLYQRALATFEKIFGPEHPDVAQSLNNLAVLYLTKGDFAKAEPLSQRALAIREKILGPVHPDVALSLNNLAEVYRVKGDYGQAEPCYQRALAILEKFRGPDHLDVALNLNNLASLYKTKGDYAKAEPLYQRSLAIREKALGPDHPDVAQSLNNLAFLYDDKGDYAKAEPLYQRALAIREKTQGPDHPEVAVSLNNLAAIYKAQGDYTQAERLYQRALAISEKALGPDHPNVAASRNNLAELYRTKGDYAQAEALARSALASKEKVLGPDHPDVAISLNNLALLSHAKGDDAQAGALYQRALAIREKTLGPDHPIVAQTLHNLARLYYAQGKLEQAIASCSQGNEATERDLRRNLGAGSERQKLLYLNTTEKRTDFTISLHAQGAAHNAAALRAALTVVLRRKGRVLDAMAESIEALRRRAAPEDRTLLDELAQTKTRLSNLILKGPGKQGIETHRTEIKELEEKAGLLEAQVSSRSAEFRAQAQPITLEAIQKAIPPDAALVEFASYRPFDAKTEQFGNRRFVVYVLTDTGEPKWADLGWAEPIDRRADQFRQALPKRLPLTQGVKGNPSTPQPDLKQIAQDLDKLVMQPVRRLVGEKKHLLLSPDGLLNLIPFAALMDEQGKFLVEHHSLSYLTSGRDLLRLQVKVGSLEPPLVMADPDYAQGNGPKLLGRSFLPLKRLAGTHEEGAKLKEILPDARLKMDAEATETLLKSVTKPSLVHIATHGYFLADTPLDAPTTGTRLLEREETKTGDVEQWRQANPFLRSWLFFAGANQGAGGGGDDGTLTALEAAGLNLWGTRLVVLSACDTGLGDVKNGDGVYGLRRALVLAGSEAQMISLWPVSDAGTRELMIDYYQRLEAGEGRSEALRQVQLKLLKDPKRRHPYFWASFIQSGEWANLAGHR
ncbi:MAG: tetratricopeptide repeat protein [Blastocatellia bacterium]|nr:tetratricopeptide repeat protein [Blastocatellia bacterium]